MIMTNTGQMGQPMIRPPAPAVPQPGGGSVFAPSPPPGTPPVTGAPMGASPMAPSVPTMRPGGPVGPGLGAQLPAARPVAPPAALPPAMTAPTRPGVANQMALANALRRGPMP